MENFAPFLQYLISGLTNGAIYALIALGFGIIYNATTIINFAQGEMVMLGALCAISIYQVIPSLPLAFAGAVVLVTCVGLVFERLALRPVADPTPIALIIITVGGGVLIKGVAMLIWGKEAYTLPPFSGNIPIHLGPATVLPQNLWVLGITAVAVVALEAFFRLTLVGKAMRACAYNTRAARLVGIAAGRMVQLSFGLSAALGAGAGILIAPLTLGVYDMGTMLGLKGFSAAIIGGLGSLAGGVLGGLVLGVAEALATGFISRLPGCGGLSPPPPGPVPAPPGAGGRTEMTRLRFLNRWVLFAVVAGAVALFMDQDYYYTLLNFIGIHTLLVVGLNLLLGYAGQISLGHAAFFGLGAYTSGILTATAGVDPWLALVAGLAVSGAAAFLIGIPALKLRGYYLAMATLGFGIIVYIILNEADRLTGGPSGLSGIPALSLAGFAFNTPRRLYLLIWIILGLILYISANLVGSRTGRAIRALHDGEAAAESLGVDTFRLKLKIFVWSALYASLAGSLYAHTLNFIAPSSFGFMFSIKLVTMVVLGGMASIWGSLLGAGALTVLPELLTVFHDFEMVIFGAILMIVMIFLPRGLVRGILDLYEFRRYKREGGRISF